MGENIQILVEALLSLKNTQASVDEIKKGLPKVSNALANDTSARVNIVAGIDLAKSKELIKSQLANIANQTNAPKIQLGVEIANAQQQMQNVASTVQNEVKKINDTKIEPKVDTKAIDGLMASFKEQFYVAKTQTAEVNAQLRDLMTNYQKSLNIGDTSQIDKARQALISFAQQYTKTFKDTSAIESLQQYKEMFPEVTGLLESSLKPELEYIYGKGKALQQVLNEAFGAGKWSLRNGNNAKTDVAFMGTPYEEFGNKVDMISRYIDTIRELKAEAKSTTNNFSNGVFDTNYITSAFGELDTKINEYNAASTKATSVANETANAFKKEAEAAQGVSSAAKNITNGYLSFDQIPKRFAESTNAALEAQKAFAGFGTSSSQQFKNADGEISSFNVLVKSATGEIERFRYLLKDIGTKENPVRVFDLANIQSANDGVNRLKDAMDKAKSNYEAKFSNFKGTNSGLMSGLEKEAVAVQTALDNLGKGGTIAEVETNFNKLSSAVGEIKANLKSLDSSLNPIDNAKNKMAEMPVTIQKIENAFNALKEPPKDVAKIIAELNRQMTEVNAIGGKGTGIEWSNSYHRLSEEVKNAQTQIKLLNEVEKGRDQGTPVSRSVENYKTLLDEVKKSWQSQGIYIDEIQKKTDNLSRSISQIKTGKGLEKWIPQFDDLVKSTITIKANLDGQVSAQNQIYQIRSKIATLKDTDTTQRTALQQTLDIKERELANLKNQSNVYSNNISLAEREKYVVEQTTKEREKYVSISNAQADKANTDAINKSNQSLKEYNKTIDNTIKSIDKMTNGSTFSKSAGNSDVQNYVAQLNAIKTQYEQLKATASGTLDVTGVQNLGNSLQNLQSKYNGTIASAQNFESTLKNTTGTDTQIAKNKVLISQMQAYMAANQKAMKSNKTSSNGNTFSFEMNNMLSQLQKGADPTTYNKIAANFRTVKNEIKTLGLEGGTVLQNLWASIKKFSSWMGITASISRLTMKIREAINEIKEVDTILTEISKTSDRTEESLRRLGDTAYDTASKYGQVASDYLLGVQEMSRAGFDESSSERMAELSTLAQSAGDMTSELANEYLIATNAAYQFAGNAEKLNSVLDSQNYVTNHNAVNMSELAEGTKIAASQAAQSGVSIDKTTAAIGTMIATTQQGGEIAARAFKGILMNLQLVKAEAEDIGDGGEAITDESLTKYEKACAALGVSLKEVKNGVTVLRDPMQVLNELSAAFNNEADNSIKKANLIAAIGGKYRGNQLSALLSNWTTYEKMLSEYNSEDTIGSALEEANKTAESLEGQINSLSNSFTSLVNHFADADTLTGAVKGLNGLVTGTTSLIDNFGVLQTLIPVVFASMSIKNVGVFGTINSAVSSLIGNVFGLNSALEMTNISVSSIGSGNLSMLVAEFNAAQQAGTMTGAVYDNFIAKVNTLSQGNTALVSSFEQLASAGSNARASLSQCYSVMLSGNTKGLTNIKSIIAQYNSLNVTTGVASQGQIAFASAVSQSNPRLGQYLGNLNGANASLKSYGTSLVSATIKTTALKVASLALNSAIGMGIGLAISGLISLITNLINAEQDVINANKELASSFKDSSSELNKLKQQYIDIIDSEKSEINKNEELSNWKDTLITKYGLEKDALADVNKEREKGLDLIDQALYKESYDTTAELKGYDDAVNKIYKASTSGRGIDSSLKTFGHYHENVDLSDIEQFGLSYTQHTNYRSASGISELAYNLQYDTSNVYEQAEKLKNALVYYKKIRDTSLDYDGQYNGTIYYLESEYDRISKIISDYGDTVISGSDAYANQTIIDFGNKVETAFSTVTDSKSFNEWKNKLLESANDSEPLKESLEKLANERFPQYSSAVEDSTISSKSSLPSVNNLTTAYTELADAIDDVLSKQNKLASVFEKMASGEILNASDVYDLFKNFPNFDFSSYTKQVEGGWVISTEGLEAANKQSIEDIKAQLTQNVNDYQEIIDTYNNKLTQLSQTTTSESGTPTFREIERATSLKSDVDTLAPQIDEANAAIARTNTIIEILDEKLVSHKAIMDSIQTSYSNSTKEIDPYNAKITKIQNAIKSMNDNTALSYDEMVALVEIEPTISDAIQQRTDGYYLEVSALEALQQASYDERNAVIENEREKTRVLMDSAWENVGIYQRELELIYQNTTLMRTLAGKETASEAQSAYNNALAEYEEYRKNYEKLGNFKNPLFVSETDNSSSTKKETDKLQQQIDYYSALISAIESVSDKRVEGLEKQKNAIQDKIDALNDEKDALQKKNDEEQRELDLINAKNNLDKAKKQKVFVYKKGEGLVQVQDTKAVSDAQKEYDNAVNAIKTAEIDNQIDKYEKQQDSIDNQIDGVNTYKEQFTNMQSTIESILTVEQAKLSLDTDEKGLLNLPADKILDIQNGFATAVLNKDKEDNIDNPNYKEISLSDFLATLGGTGSFNDAISSFNSSVVTPNLGEVWKTNNTSNVVNNNGGVTLSPVFNISGADNPKTVADTVMNMMIELFTDMNNKTK